MYKHSHENNMSAGVLNNSMPPVNRFASFGIQTDEPEVKIIKKKKRPASFERRFLSACGKGENCILEVAMVWNGNVMSIHQYPAKAGTEISVGEDSGCQYHVNGSQKTVIASCGSSGLWMLHHRSMNGFVLNGNQKVPFDDIMPGTVVSGEIRAKYIFGEVSVLIHYIESKAFASAGGAFHINKYGALAASMLLHFALFSIILFTTDRVDALMIDRIMTTSRFAMMVEPEEPAAEPEDKIDEVEVVEVEETPEVVNIARDSSSKSFAPEVSNSNGPMTKEQARTVAAGTGLLNQRTAMNSLLASASNMQNFDNLEWSTFDSSVNADNAGFLTASSVHGGSIMMGRFNNGGIGPVDNSSYRGVIDGIANFKPDRIEKKEHIVDVRPQKIDVSGSLDKRQILKVVKMHTNELRNCYEKELTKIKGLNGRVVLVWVISPQGSVTKVIKKESSLKNANVENCIMNSVKFWRFPAPRNGGSTMIEYPFVFDVSGK